MCDCCLGGAGSDWFDQWVAAVSQQDILRLWSDICRLRQDQIQRVHLGQGERKNTPGSHWLDSAWYLYTVKYRRLLLCGRGLDKCEPNTFSAPTGKFSETPLLSPNILYLSKEYHRWTDRLWLIECCTKQEMHLKLSYDRGVYEQTFDVTVLSFKCAKCCGSARCKLSAERIIVLATYQWWS